MRDFIRETEERYDIEIDAFLNLYRKNRTLNVVLSPFLREIGEYLSWLRWVGWNISNLGPILYENTSVVCERLALAMLAYAAGRLIDDGFDNHETFKGHRKNLVGALRSRNKSMPLYQICVQSAFIGFNLFHFALRRMRECSQIKCAEEVGHLFEVTSVGVIAECLVGPKVDIHLYRQIIRRKAVAYNMILYKPFLTGLDSNMRLSILKILANMDEVAQVINDFHDIQEDRERGQINAFNYGIYDRTSLKSEIFSLIKQLNKEISSMPPKLQDALAAMFNSLGIFSLWGEEQEVIKNLN